MATRPQKLSEKHWVVKQNILNEMRDFSMNLTQLRLFAIYQAKINSKNPDSRNVIFPLDEFERIMEIKRANTTVINEIGKSLTRQSENDEWFVSLNCTHEILPFMFEYRKNFFKYALWNALRLKSPNQVRMYEILKQFEKTGTREITLADLREYLGIKKNEYPRWNNFKARVLDSCQQALAETTDIRFNYEILRSGKGGGVKGIRFSIEKNEEYIDQLCLEEFINLQDMPVQEEEPNEVVISVESAEPEIDPLELYIDALPKTLRREQVDVLQMAARTKLLDMKGSDIQNIETEIYDFMSAKVRLMKSSKKPVETDRQYNWLRKAIQEDWK
jgi:hypothetical protein